MSVLAKERQNEKRPKFGATYPRETTLCNSNKATVGEGDVLCLYCYCISKQLHILK